MINLEKILEQYGLTKKQARIYLACLALGSSAVQKIAQRTGLARSTTYEVLESLREKGLVSTFRKKTIKYFSAEEPEKIVEEAQRRAILLKNNLARLEEMQLQARFQPTVRFYQGKRGVITVLEEVLKEAKEILSFNSPEDLFASLETYFPRFVQRRIKKKIPVKAICYDSPKAQERKQLGPRQLRQVRIIPAKYQHHGIMLIWKNKIAMFSLREDFEAVVIESAELAAIQKAMLNFMWDSLPD